MGEVRHRGGQPGNRNALRHGYYSKIFKDNKDAMSSFCSAADVQGIDEEIALIRHVIKSAAAANQDKYLSILVRATNALNRLVRTRYQLTGKGRYAQLEEAIRGVVTNVLEPMGVQIGSAIINKRYSENEGTNTPQNEARLP
jgi:hypothetical protein